MEKQSDKIIFTNRTSVYHNISKTHFFSRIKYVPCDNTEMMDFIMLQDGHNFFKKSNWKHLTLYHDATSLQLDAFFILLRSINHYYDQMLNLLKITMRESVSIFTDTVEELIKVSEHPEFFSTISRYILDDLHYNFNAETFKNTAAYALDSVFNYSSIVRPYNDTLLDEKFQATIVEYIKSHARQAELFFRMTYDRLITKLNLILPMGQNIIELCSKQINNNEILVLENFVKKYSYLEPDYNNDPILVNYYYYMEESIRNTNRTNCNSTYITNFYENFIRLVDARIANIGYQIVKPIKNSWLHGIDDCFVQCGFASNTKEIAYTVYNIMAIERDTSAYTNKYEDMTLHDHFYLISVANDVEIQYDTFLNLILQKGKIPYEYPIEILLRILSRLYNVIIVLYSDTLMRILIDNALDPNARTINMVQYTSETYFNIVTIGSEFIALKPNEQKPTISYKIQPVVFEHNSSNIINAINANDINDIIEV